MKSLLWTAALLGSEFDAEARLRRLVRVCPKSSNNNRKRPTRTRPGSQTTTSRSRSSWPRSGTSRPTASPSTGNASDFSPAPAENARPSIRPGNGSTGRFADYYVALPTVRFRRPNRAQRDVRSGFSSRRPHDRPRWSKPARARRAPHGVHRPHGVRSRRSSPRCRRQPGTSSTPRTTSKTRA